MKDKAWLSELNKVSADAPNGGSIGVESLRL